MLTLYKDRLIAMLDVIGFDGRLSCADDLSSVVKTYADLIREAKIHAFVPKPVQGSKCPPPNFDLGEFVFDTLVFVSKPIDVHSVKDFMLALCLISEKFLGQRFPLRGAISVGDICIESDPHLVISDKFKRLTEASAHQEWTGCIVLPEAEEIVSHYIFGFDQLGDLLQSSIAHRYLPPWKASTPSNLLTGELLCLNWSYMMPRSQFSKGMSFLTGIKSENTNIYLNWLRSLPDDRQNLPTEFKPATKLMVMKTRAGCRVVFQDAIGEPAHPGCSFTLGLLEPQCSDM